jgi:hypothetical protein
VIVGYHHFDSIRQTVPPEESLAAVFTNKTDQPNKTNKTNKTNGANPQVFHPFEQL